ncbi:hypothetical protein [Micromonospora sp. AMSO31t]|uniref:hypothetical protein n=1 Tax=Micromonospora sp. AMSO31t TaxID=2650566 RepID=UPI00124B7A75|nr:hypothetical protein [Micromonospora sp. AMSO31t]KAB1910690.1 hypothetical protein F8274_20010 [Micromonospora sp. AMSO31t]
MNTVKHTLTSVPRQGRRREVVENDEFAAFARRIIRAHGRRVATGDVEALRDLVALSAVIDDAIGEAVIGLRAFGYSWAEIGARLGISRQAAQQRWGGQS